MKHGFFLGGTWPLLVLLLLATGCGEDRPRTRKEIFRERTTLPRLYLTTPSGHKVTAPADRGVFVDEESGEICWPALQCSNPACPGRTEDGPVLLIDADPGVVLSGGSLSYDAGKGAKQDPHAGQCPSCLEIRNLKRETDKERQQYFQWIIPHTLPETAKRLEALRAEEERLKEYIEERKYRE